jgi:hypothetical protein
MVKLFVWCTLIILGVSAHSVRAQSPSSLTSELNQLNKDFTYRGKPIHPRAVKDLTSWISDQRPGPIAVDIAGTFESNQYFGVYSVQENGNVFVDLTQEYIEQEGSFSYKHLGRLANGLHVLLTYFHGGGSGVFQSVLLIECSIDFEYIHDGSRKSILMMQRRGEFGLGDRYNGTISIDAKGSSITVGPDNRNIEKGFTMRLQE